ncbi:MAG: Ribonuclease R [Turneriella sp.]|nr:Ribonuclease R [Turneriella sp.]
MDKETEKLLDQWIFHAYKSGNTTLPIAEETTKEAKAHKNKKRKQRRVQYTTDATIEHCRSFLKAYSLIEKKEARFILKNVQKGILSVAKSGVAFVQIQKGLEALVPFNARGQALHRDKVEIILTGISRGRVTAKVRQVLEPFSTEYLAHILGFTQSVGGKFKGEKLALAELVDLPDRPQILLKTKNITKKIVYVMRSALDSEFLKSASNVLSEKNNSRSSYQRITSSVFELSKREVKENRKGDLERLRLRFMLPGDFEKSIVPPKKTIEAHTKEALKEEVKKGKRKKISNSFIFTIDGADAKDFDDAISVTEDASGFNLDVHIADVGFFIAKDSPLFEEALRRGNSYYLSNSVIPMLPEIYSNEYCSLKPKTTRLAFTSRMRFDRQGKMLHYEFFKSVIYIDKRFTYEEAHENLKSKKSPLLSALKLSKILIETRDKAGRVELNFSEEKPTYDKNGTFTGFTKIERLSSHRLVEECMLSANQAAASYAIRHNFPILHRNHESMPVEKLEKLNRYLEKYVPRLKLRSAKQTDVNYVLNDAALKSVKEVFQFLLLRSFMQANYAPEAKGHWGLAFSHYAHFTSPIRRFADLVTHLQIAAHLEKRKLPFSMDELDFFGREASRLERIAFEAERADKKLLAIRALQNRVGDSFTGWLSSFSSDRLFVTLYEFPAEGEIDAANVDRRGEISIRDDFSVFAGKLQKTLSLGDKLHIRLIKADVLSLALKFEFVQPKSAK